MEDRYTISNRFWSRVRRWLTFATNSDRPWMKLAFAGLVSVFAAVAGLVVAFDSAKTLVSDHRAIEAIAQVIAFLSVMISALTFLFGLRGGRPAEPDAVTQLRRVTKSAYTNAVRQARDHEEASS
jgi:hypothetical protein